MRHCSNCKVDILGDWDTCPLCRNPVRTQGIDVQESPFPDIPLRFHKYLAVKILTSLSVITVVLSFITYQIWPIQTNWPLLVLFGLISMWLIVGLIIQKKRNIAKSIVYQIALLSLLSVLWDCYIGWSGWSVNYAIPIICSSALAAMFVSVRIVKLVVGDYVLYLLIAALLALIPLLFILFGWISHPIPSFVSLCLSVVMLVAVLIFRGREIAAELQKRMHI